MWVADEFLGTLDDSEVAARVADADDLTVTLDDTERRRSRVRTTAEDGTDVGIVVGREVRDGDVLLADGRPVVVSLEPVDVLVLEFDGVDGDATAATGALALGHAVGNRHWDLTVAGDRAYLPVADSRERMLDEIDGALPDGVTVGFDTVSPALFDDATPDHDHAHGTGGAHAHSHGHGSDSHGHGHDHSSDGHDHPHGPDGHDHADHAVRPLDPDGGEES